MVRAPRALVIHYCGIMSHVEANTEPRASPSTMQYKPNSIESMLYNVLPLPRSQCSPSQGAALHVNTTSGVPKPEPKVVPIRIDDKGGAPSNHDTAGCMQSERHDLVTDNLVSTCATNDGVALPSAPPKRRVINLSTADESRTSTRKERLATPKAGTPDIFSKLGLAVCLNRRPPTGPHMARDVASRMPSSCVDVDLTKPSPLPSTDSLCDGRRGTKPRARAQALLVASRARGEQWEAAVARASAETTRAAIASVLAAAVARDLASRAAVKAAARAVASRLVYMATVKAVAAQVARAESECVLQTLLSRMMNSSCLPPSTTRLAALLSRSLEPNAMPKVEVLKDAICTIALPNPDPQTNWVHGRQVDYQTPDAICSSTPASAALTIAECANRSQAFGTVERTRGCDVPTTRATEGSLAAATAVSTDMKQDAAAPGPAAAPDAPCSSGACACASKDALLNLSRVPVPSETSAASSPVSQSVPKAKLKEPLRSSIYHLSDAQLIEWLREFTGITIKEADAAAKTVQKHVRGRAARRADRAAQFPHVVFPAYIWLENAEVQPPRGVTWRVAAMEADDVVRAGSLSVGGTRYLLLRNGPQLGFPPPTLTSPASTTRIPAPEMRTPNNLKRHKRSDSFVHLRQCARRFAYGASRTLPFGRRGIRLAPAADTAPKKRTVYFHVKAAKARQYADISAFQDDSNDLRV